MKQILPIRKVGNAVSEVHIKYFSEGKMCSLNLTGQMDFSIGVVVSPGFVCL